MTENRMQNTLSTFEALPDEIIMIIFQYSGDAYTILKTFLGLNQRLNRILIDKRLDLFTNLLQMKIEVDCYDSEIFQQTIHQLLLLKSPVDESKLSSILKRLISFQIRQKYIQLGNKFQSLQKQFQSIRQSLSNNEMTQVDHEIETNFHNLYQSISKTSIKTISSLVVTKGARCHCDDNELCRFNLTKAVNHNILSHTNYLDCRSEIPLNLLVELFQNLIISNTSLISNKDYVGNGGLTLEFFLVYSLYKLKDFYSCNSMSNVNMQYYRVAVDIFLFVVQCQKHAFDNEEYIREIMLDMLSMFPKTNDNIFIEVCQLELMKIVADEYVAKAREPWDEFLTARYKDVIKNLFQNNRLDVLSYIYCDSGFAKFFDIRNDTRECLNLMTRNRYGRTMFFTLVDTKILELIFSARDVLFILLDKKERKLLEKLLKSLPHLIHELDEEGNDPLLYTCLKVYGCRHGIVEFLIKVGADRQRKNFKGENFTDAIQLSRNKELFKKLIEHQIITLEN